MFEHAPPGFGRRGRRETGPSPFPGVGHQCELRYQQQTATDITQAPIHATLRIAKHPVAEQAFQQPGSGGLIIALFNADEDQQSGTDGTNLASFHGHPRFAYPL